MTQKYSFTNIILYVNESISMFSNYFSFRPFFKKENNGVASIAYLSINLESQVNSPRMDRNWDKDVGLDK